MSLITTCLPTATTGALNEKAHTNRLVCLHIITLSKKKKKKKTPHFRLHLVVGTTACQHSTFKVDRPTREGNIAVQDLKIAAKMNKPSSRP
jgi:hypothetical protein